MTVMSLPLSVLMTVLWIKYTIFLDFERIWWRFFHERFVILYNGIGDLWTGWPALIWERKYSCWHHPLMLAAGYPKALIHTCLEREHIHTYNRWFITNLQEAPWVDAKRNKVLLVSSADWSCWYRRISMHIA
jgi:hypothetical protein